MPYFQAFRQVVPGALAGRYVTVRKQPFASLHEALEALSSVQGYSAAEILIVESATSREVPGVVRRGDSGRIWRVGGSPPGGG